jgi:hypothetical protein
MRVLLFRCDPLCHKTHSGHPLNFRHVGDRSDPAVIAPEPTRASRRLLPAPMPFLVVPCSAPQDPCEGMVKLTVPHGLRIWRKLHLAVDAASNTLVAATLTANSEGDTITRREVPTAGPSPLWRERLPGALTTGEPNIEGGNAAGKSILRRYPCAARRTTPPTREAWPEEIATPASQSTTPGAGHRRQG